MSWHFRKAGHDKELLKAAVQAETSCPQPIRDELCMRIDELRVTDEIIVIASHGHLADGPRPWQGTEEIVLHVRAHVHVKRK